MQDFLIDNVVKFGERVYQQTIGFPMGNNSCIRMKLTLFVGFTFPYIADNLPLNNCKLGYYVDRNLSN